MCCYRKPAPDQAMLIFGGDPRRTGEPFRVVTGRGAFVLPIFRKVRFLSLAPQEAEILERYITNQDIVLNLRARVTFKVGNDPTSIARAGQRFLSDEGQMRVLTGRIFAAQFRLAIGSMTLEQVVTERQKLSLKVLAGSKAEMTRLGLSIDSLQIRYIDDMGAGHLAAMAARRKEDIQRHVETAGARAEQQAEEQAEEQAAEEQQD